MCSTKVSSSVGFVLSCIRNVSSMVGQPRPGPGSMEEYFCVQYRVIRLYSYQNNQIHGHDTLEEPLHA